MEICLEINDQPVRTEISAGLLLSELLQEQGLSNESVWLDGYKVNPTLMLAAQAQGKKVSQTGGAAEPLSEEVLIAAEPTGATR